MVAYKLVISNPKTGKSMQQEANEENAHFLNGLKIGDTVEGTELSLAGYEFLITGGSDNAGFPMRKDFNGTGKKKILAVEGVGLKKKAKGIRQRKTIAGNTIYEGTAQINLKILKQGTQDLFAKKAEETDSKTEVKEEKVEEKKTEEKQTQKESKSEHKEEKVAENKKAE